MNNTLILDTTLLDKAFAKAAELNIDLSRYVEKYLQRFVGQNEDSDTEITPFVASLGIGVPTTEDDENLKNDYIDYLEKNTNDSHGSYRH